MPPALRNLFPYLVFVAIGMALVWAVSFGTLPQADFTFANGDQISTIDPAKATGSPENRVINGLFEGLLRNIPYEVPGGVEKNLKQNVPLVLAPGVAELPAISADGKTYTFKLRPDAKWSNGRTVNADDFVFSWQRLLHPETASEYGYQLHYVVGAERYNLAQLAEGDEVEVELYDRKNPAQQYPRGTLLRGKLTKIHEPSKLEIPADISGDDKSDLEAAWKSKIVYSIAVESTQPAGDKNRENKPKIVHVAKEPTGAKKHFSDGKIEKCHHVLVDFEKVVKIKALDERTLRIELNNPTPYFGELIAFYPLYPVCRECVEQYGTPDWTNEENIVSNGAFKLKFHRFRDRIRMVKSDTYWNRDKVELQSVDALAVKGETTALNMYMSGQVDWINTVPGAIVPDLKLRDDFHTPPMLTVYFYRLNVNKKPLDNVLVRRALNAAINKKDITERVLKAGQLPARSYVPPLLTEYKPSLCGEFDLTEARRLLAEAGYPNGEGLPPIEIIFNVSDDHRSIAEVIQQHWKAIGVKGELRQLEWGSFLASLSNKDYTAGRSAWIADYRDPITFLDMFVTDGPNNQTNWSNADYDKLIKEAKATAGEERLATLNKAERILMDELPILPIYFYVQKNMVKPRIEGFTSNIQDLHPLELLRVKRDK